MSTTMSVFLILSVLRRCLARRVSTLSVSISQALFQGWEGCTFPRVYSFKSVHKMGETLLGICDKKLRSNMYTISINHICMNEISSKPGEIDYHTHHYSKSYQV